jgi:hypothetical protein
MMKTTSKYITTFDQLSVQDPSCNCAPSASSWEIAEKICELLVAFLGRCSGSFWFTISYKKCIFENALEDQMDAGKGSIK